MDMADPNKDEGALVNEAPFNRERLNFVMQLSRVPNSAGNLLRIVRADLASTSLRNSKRGIRKLFLCLSVALTLVPWSAMRADLVRARLEGVVNSSPIPALNGHTWKLDFVFDTAAPEVPFFAQIPNLGVYHNTLANKVLLSLDFSIGDSSAFEIHLLDPVPVQEGDVRIDIDNFGTKTFNLHADDATLLPAWQGLQIRNFLLRLGDGEAGGFSDGTDRLPSADPSVSIAEFTSSRLLRLTMGPAGQTTQLTGTPTSFTLTPVPEISSGGLCAAGLVVMFALKRRRNPAFC